MPPAAPSSPHPVPSGWPPASPNCGPPSGPIVAQFDNHSDFRGGIPPAWAHFGPVVATCLDLDVVPRFIPLARALAQRGGRALQRRVGQEVLPHGRFSGLEHLIAENPAFVTYHNEHHRYSAHGGASPDEVWSGRTYQPLPATPSRPTWGPTAAWTSWESGSSSEGSTPTGTSSPPSGPGQTGHRRHHDSEIGHDGASSWPAASLKRNDVLQKTSCSDGTISCGYPVWRTNRTMSFGSRPSIRGSHIVQI